ncbi:MAG: putative molybdenum carrier protein [Burkholderiales bacterium]
MLVTLVSGTSSSRREAYSAAMGRARRPLRIVSGGQTGVDRAALDAALALGLPAGGWCPRGRIAKDGRLARRYPLQETPSADYAPRTESNVRDSDGTLILNRGRLDGGTLLTARLAARYGRPCLVVQLERRVDLVRLRGWIARHRIRTLNVAGPRESKRRGIYEQARAALELLLANAVMKTQRFENPV